MPTQLESALPPSILDRIGVPIFVVEKGAQLRYANAAGSHMLANSGPLRAIDNVLSADYLPDSQRLKSAIANSFSAGESQVVMMKDTGTRRPPIAVIVPMRNGGEEQALVLLRQSPASNAALVNSLRQLFRLSPAEAAIAISLATGADLQEIAEERNVKLNTLRSQIASIMAKTNTRRQAELVALVARLESPV
mgnify:CR=1 FL=1